MIFCEYLNPFSQWAYQGKCVQFLRVLQRRAPAMLSLANVYPCVLLFAFFACEQLPSCLTDIPGRFHKSQPQKAINNAWGRWKRVKRHVHNFAIRPITTNHASPSPLTTKHPPIHKLTPSFLCSTDSSCQFQDIDSTKSTYIWVFPYPLQRIAHRKLMAAPILWYMFIVWLLWRTV